MKTPQYTLVIKKEVSMIKEQNKYHHFCASKLHCAKVNTLLKIFKGTPDHFP